MRDEITYLEHIHQSILKIRSFTAEGRDAFMRDEKTQDAVIRNFEIIGEAVKQISDETKARRPEIPWRDIANLRNVLIHNYMNVQLKRVWSIVERDLGPLQEAIEDLLDLD